jgi:uncharacterized protein YfbU (UPF0304 family)
MTLTDGEKLILLMLSEIHQKLGITGGIDSEFVKDAIYYDKLWSLSWQMSGIPFQQTETPAVVKDTVDILEMWDTIEWTFENLSDTDKEKVRSAYGDRDVKFLGFDGNNEDHYGTATFLVDKMGRFQRFKGRDLNSHMPSIDIYKRMYRVYQPIRSSVVPGVGLSANSVINILAARIHPESRR